MEKEPDYKEMYFKMVRASEDAINILIEAQRECEELYISMEKTEIKQERHPEESL
ncbi:MAG: hypothetical protein Q4E35_02760 [Eubacteriales bacterium]|nr:hypothetical protein [Eubacteriales bacterium]